MLLFSATRILWHLDGQSSGKKITWWLIQYVITGRKSETKRSDYSRESSFVTCSPTRKKYEGQCQEITGTKDGRSNRIVHRKVS